ncbi:efflux RND transporter permease subunit [Rickettsiella massiliensis]|uniref:efflux RND transporter permease subunit n=1 Tax=Rickettsiella massiliensis TaxID=676517 RepID=UPI0038B5F75A
MIGLISKHDILIVQFANDLQKTGHSKQEAIQLAAGIRLRPILMTTACRNCFWRHSTYYCNRCRCHEPF